MNINSCHILLKNVLFFAHHGVAPQETVTGNEFYINMPHTMMSSFPVSLHTEGVD